MPRPHIIIVDDDSAARDSVSALLAAFEYDVTSFNSAEAFLAAGGTPERACLLLDAQLPGMNGRDLQKKLNHECIQLPVILISGNTDSALTAAAMENGAIAVLEKPVNPRSLVEHVQRAFQNQDT